MKKKLIVDILMFVLLILEFSRMYMPTILHELIGIWLLVLIILHLIFNKDYLKKIPNGKYNGKRGVMLGVNILLILSFLLSILFGTLSSQDILKFLNIHSLTITKLHKVMSYLSLIIVGLHLGINFNAMFGKLKSKIKNKIILYGVSIIIIIFGIYSWIQLDIWNHLIGKYGFSVVTGNILINIIEYFSIIMMISIITSFIYNRKEK